VERAEGRTTSESADREWRQYALDTVYRFLPNETLFVGARYSKADGQLAGLTDEVGARRWQLGAGWFLAADLLDDHFMHVAWGRQLLAITPGLLAKAEYVNQEYVGFPAANIKNGGRFQGVMLEGVVAF
jgi:hypothetical protein